MAIFASALASEFTINFIKIVDEIDFKINAPSAKKANSEIESVFRIEISMDPIDVVSEFPEVKKLVVLASRIPIKKMPMRSSAPSSARVKA